VAAVAEHADAAVVDCAFVSIIEQNLNNESVLLEKIRNFTTELRKVIDTANITA